MTAGSIREMPLISIIVPVYKTKKYLRKCVNSILVQTYENIEVILVDDGSPDSCGAVCDEYAIKDERVRVIHKTNGGLSSARNAGLDIAKGDYIGFVDSDDYISPKMYEKLLLAMQKVQAELGFCNIQHVNKRGLLPNKDPYVYKAEIIPREKLISGINRIPSVSWNKLYGKELFKCLRFKEGKLNEDEFIWHHIAVQVNKAAVVPDKLYFYFKHSDSITGLWDIRRLDAVEAMFERSEFLKNLGFMAEAKESYKSAYAAFINSLDKLLKKEEKVKLSQQYHKIMIKLILTGRITYLLRAAKLFVYWHKPRHKRNK